MTAQPKFTQWHNVIAYLNQSQTSAELDEVLSVLLTQDERDALLARMNIVHELLEGNLSQRQISQMLGVGIATITRGSNELKKQPEALKSRLKSQLQQQAQLLETE
ncbi:Trp operon repressor [Vibrio stylophorae]|jgi:TrpR family trp operon transcriptional repressor|uniref:Trp operon repressor homolog n=1 Tax=Vibrio stylophorae TaxID=659351 RepID=A0ABN8DNJ8_9VIBR|nr:trp operon repressor [Vibrio stylophorae]CAH0532734.1 Trp operon repressor [Vibrio stylophorae]